MEIKTVNTLCVSAFNMALSKVEVTITDGIGIHIIGLPDGKAKESLFRVVTVLQSMGIRIPGKKVIINIRRPSLVKIKWELYDLSIFVALKAAINGEKVDKYAWYLGELDLLGNIQPLKYPLNAAALSDIIEDGYLVCPKGSFPRNAMINSVNAI